MAKLFPFLRGLPVITTMFLPMVFFLLLRGGPRSFLYHSAPEPARQVRTFS